MIEIQVDRLVKSFEVGHNVLDGLTFQIDQGERGGPSGAQWRRKDHVVQNIDR